MKKPSMVKKVGIILLVIIIVLIGLNYGIIGGLLGAALAGLILKKTNVVSSDSMWVKETKGLKIAKYVILVIFLLLIAGAFVYILLGN